MMKNKGLQWVLIGGVALVIIVIIYKEATKPTTYVTGSSSLFGSGGIVGGLTNLFKAVGPATASPSYTPGGSVNYSDANGTGAAYAAAMASSGEVASATAGFQNTAGSTTFTGGSGASANNDPLGIGSLQDPGFSVGVSGADFTS